MLFYARMSPFILILPLLVSMGAAQAASPEYGYVAGIKGSWTDHTHGGQPVQPMQSVFVDSQFVVAQPSANAYLEIRFSDQSLKTFSCRQPAVCSGPLKLPAPPEKPSGFLTFVLGILSREGPPPAQMSSRGGAVLDGLALIRDQQVDIRALLETTPPERYVAGWCATPLSTSCEKPEREFAVDLSKTGPRVVSAPRPGLARLRIKKPDEPWASASEAWTLALPEPGYSIARDKLAEVHRETSNWSGEDPNFPALFRLYLKALAEDGPSPR
jgi:hypothetical protein